MSGCAVEKNVLVKQIHIPLSCSFMFATHLNNLYSGFVPFRAVRQHAREHFLRLRVWDGDDVLVVCSHDFLRAGLLSEVRRPLALVLGGRRRGGAGDGTRGAECWVGDWEGRGQAGFGAGHCRVVTLQEVLAHLVVRL